MNPLPSEKNTDEEPSDEAPSPAPVRPLDILYQRVPALEALRTYSLGHLRQDVLAGLTVASVAVPQAMAYATIAGLPPQYGLYTAIVMTLVGALLDSSRQLINGPTNAICIALLSALIFVAPEHRIPAAVFLAFLVGLVQTGITLLRLGDLTRYISHAVIVGFTFGAAVLLVLDQFKHFLGLPERGEPRDHFLRRFWMTLQHIEKTNLWTLGIGLGSIAMVLGLSQLRKRLQIPLPELLLTVALMAFLVWKFDGQAAHGIRVVEDIPAVLPRPAFPDFTWLTWDHFRRLAGSALAIAILGLLEAIAMAKAIAARTGQKLDINQQCLSEGLANLSGSFFQCIPGSGSLTRSAINVQAGAVSQWSGVVAALAVAATVLLLAPLAYYIPRASLAGILMVSAWRLVDRKQLLYHLRTTRFDAGIVLATAVSAVAISVEFCILIGVFLSFVMFVPKAARLHLTQLTLTPARVIQERSPADPPCGRILIFSLEGELFFGSAPDLEKHFETISRLAQASLSLEEKAARGEGKVHGIRVIVLRLKRVRNPDAVCLELFDRFLTRMQNRNITVLLCGVRNDLARVLQSSGLWARFGPRQIFREEDGPLPLPPGEGKEGKGRGAASSTLDAVRHAYELLGDDLCSTCPRRGEMGKEVLYYMI